MNETNLLTHTQPHSVEAEQKLISSCLFSGNSSAYDTVRPIVEAEDFYVLRFRLLYEAIGELSQLSHPIDIVSISEHLKSVGGLDDVGGIPGVMSLADGEVYTENAAKFYAKVVAEKSRLREIMKSCRIAVENVESEALTYDEIRSSLEADITARPLLSQNKSGIGASADELMDDIARMQAGDYVPDVVKTHTNNLDSELGNRGIAAGEVMTVAAPTSCGKSALALYIVSQAVAKDGHACGVFSLEMPQKQLTKRLTQVISGVNLRSVEDNVAKPEQVKRVHETISELKTMPVYTSHSVKSADDLYSQTKQFVQKQGVKLLVIDYLQLIPFSSKMGKAEGIASISHKIKQMAIDLNIAIILLAQVNREGAKNGRLKLYDLKDSGDIENDADVVLLMYPSNGDVDSSKSQDARGGYTSLTYEIAKNREGERDIGGTFKFYHCTGRFG
jgi:replicative DNA helicase|tara:strand:- start:2203 stop:3540 length:1338 start_codon:yes stop_codon:yes gene_type:complete